MSPKVVIPPYMRPLADNMKEVEVKGSTVGGCLHYLVEQCSGIKEMLFAKDGELLDYVAIYVNGEDTYPEGLAKSVEEKDELRIVHMFGGGQNGPTLRSLYTEG